MSSGISVTISNLTAFEKKINDYKKSIDSKLQRFNEKLCDVGITMAQSKVGYIYDLGNAKNNIYFKKQTTLSNGTATTLLIAVGVEMVQVWLGIDKESHKEITKTALVNPLLMAEYGSGSHAEKSGMRGTFPRSDGQKPSLGANDSWSWKDGSGWHSSTGIIPTQPMYNAYKEMFSQIESVAREVFSSNV